MSLLHDAFTTVAKSMHMNTRLPAIQAVGKTLQNVITELCPMFERKLIALSIRKTPLRSLYQQLAIAFRFGNDR